MKDTFDNSLVKRLAIKALSIDGSSRKEIDRTCWLVVHEHLHGVMPSEYDVREIDESLYLLVLREAEELDSIA